MRHVLGFVLFLAAALPVWCASKPHVVFLGKSQPVKTFSGRDENQSVTINVRPLYVDTKLKDYTTGDAHDVTDRQFVVQRAFRMNDFLPGDSPKQSKWIWERGDWLLVDRISGRIIQIKLPEFDSIYSRVSWYRDYAAYCGVSDNGVRWNAIVAQIGVRKALFHKDLGKSAEPEDDPRASQCLSPKWERRPPRVTFILTNGQPLTVNVTARHAQELMTESEGEQ
jgi:hypothetical protein